MKTFENSKLKLKFYLFSAMLILCLLLTGIYSLVLIGIINDKTTEISSNVLPSVIIAEELNTAISRFRIAEIIHVISEDDEDMKEYSNSISNIAMEIEVMFSEYEQKLIRNDIDKALVAQARSLWSGYIIVHERMIKFSKNNDVASAMRIMENESAIVFAEVSSVFSRLVEFNTETAEETNSSGDDLYASTHIMLTLVVIFAFIITLQFKALIREIENNQEKLAHSNEEAVLSSQAKSNFLANMSHEIRTPMNAISGMIDIILRETKDKNVIEYAQNIKRACDSLLFIINDVLDFSKIESGKLDIVESDYCLSDVLNDVITIANNRLEHKNLKFITNFQNDIPEKLIGDEVRVKQVMVNILNNAIKFTEEGHVAFNVRGSYFNGFFKLEFSIVDTGVGISQDSIEKLFEEFERVDTKKNRNIEGTGLGLAISKRLAEMMEGEIKVKSQLGKGTIFTVTVLQKYKDYVPLSKVKEEKSVLVIEPTALHLESIKKACIQLDIQKFDACALQSEFNDALVNFEYDFVFTTALYYSKVKDIITQKNYKSKIVLLAENTEEKTKFDCTCIVLPANSLSLANVLNGKTIANTNMQAYGNFIAPKCKVLVVDDNHVNLIVAQGLMKPYQFEVETAINGQEAVDKIKENKYDLVFMDHMMPILDGIDATILIRSLEGTYFKNIPIIALTANAIVGTQEMFLKHGMNDFLDKPIKVHRLNEVLATWLPKNHQIPVTDEEFIEETASEQEDDTPIRIAINNVDTNLGIQRIGGNFEDYINILNHYYKDGVKRHISISDLFDKRQFKDYKIEVHAIKSASASIGAIKLSDKAKRLEDACNVTDWEYVDLNNDYFLEDFNTLLEDINNALDTFINQNNDDEGKEEGEQTLLLDNLMQLKDALDNVDIKLCEDLLDDISSYKWEQSTSESINKIKEFVDDYEYDEAIEIIDSIIN